MPRNNLLIKQALVTASVLTALTAAPAFAGDDVTTCAVYTHNKHSHVVKLQPFNGAEFLKERLDGLPEPNRSVVAALLDYPRDGTHPYNWPRGSDGQYDGSSRDVLVGETVLMRGNGKGETYCCGLTLEVYVAHAAPEAMKTKWAAGEGWTEFKRAWFCRQLNSPGPEEALIESGLGRKVTEEEALAGDFVQIWRNNKSGHSVIFVDWARSPDGKIAGLHYWSTQTSTDGVGFRAEAFGSEGSSVRRDILSIARPTTAP